MMKKILSLAAALALCLSLTVPAFAAGSPFTDVPENEYYYAPVLWAVEQEITTGVTPTTFVPCAPCSRAEIITFLWRAAGSPEPVGNNPFTDVDVNQYYGKAAVWAGEMGMADGTTFSPGAPCTRAMAVEFLWKYAGSPSAVLTVNFTDVAEDASYRQAVAWAVKAGVTTGTTDTTFSPSDICTRGQIMTFLYRAFA